MSRVNLKITLGFLISPYFLVALFSCCREDPVETARIEFKDNELQLIPYEYGQKISFIHSNGFEFELSVVEDTITWDSYSEFCEWDCCGKEYISYQERTTKLESSYPVLAITMIISSYGDYLRSFTLDINHRHFLNLRYDSLENFICDPYFEMICFDSVIIQNKMYKDVVEKKFDTHYFIEDSTILVPESILYNSLGLLQIKMSNAETFSINN